MAGAGSIPLTEVQAYCALHGVTGENRLELIELLTVLDREFLELSNGLRDRNQGQN
jgi:hypothetical protein